MPTLRIFEPAMCCPTGVCGPTVDPELARVGADLAWLRQQGVTVERYNLAQQPGAFVEHEAVQVALMSRGEACLPLVLVDNRVAAEGTYPSRETLAALAGVVVKKLDIAPAASPCCGPSTAEAAARTATAPVKSGCC